MKLPLLYCDHSASTPPHPEVIRTVAEVMEKVYANPSSLHHAGAQADQLVRRARAGAASVLQVHPSEIIVTSGATKSNNLAIWGTARAYAKAGRPRHMIVSEVEHASVYECYKQLEHEGVDVTYIPVNRKGCVQPEQIEAALRSDTIMVSIMHVNHETGSIQPIAAIGKLLLQYPKVAFHVDGVQGFGKVPLGRVFKV